MKNLTWNLGFIIVVAIVGIIFGLTFLLLAKDHDNTLSSQGPIHCDSPSFDIGKLYRPAPKMLQPRFTIRNTSQSPVTLRVAGTSCACSKVKITKNALEPGEQTELCLDWHLSGIIGRSKFQVFVESNLHGLLTLSGSVNVCDVFMLDERGVDIGDVKPGETKTGHITIRPWGGEILSNEICVKNGTSMVSEFKVTEKTRTTNKIVFSVSVTGQAALGEKTYSLAIETGNSIQPVVEVPVLARHLDMYEAKPSVVTLSNKKNASDIEVVANGGLPAVIERIVVDDDSPLFISQSNTSTFKVQRRQGKLDTVLTGTISVFVHDNPNPILLRYICF